MIFFLLLTNGYTLGVIDSNNADPERLILTDSEMKWLEDHGSLVYAADRNAPPLRFVDAADGQYKGVVVDYVNSLSLELGVNIEMHPMIWEDALKNLNAGKSDLCDMFISEERSQYYLFTKPIYNLRAVFAVQSGGDPANTISAERALVIATQKGDYANGYLKETYPKAALRYTNDIAEALALLYKGEVDAVAGDEPVVLCQIDEMGLKGKMKILGKPLYENEVVFAVPKSQPQLITILNKGIDAINKKGQLEKIQQKWFGISAPIVKAPDYERLKTYILIVVGILLSAVAAMITWNYFLKKQVEIRTSELKDNRNELQTIFDGMTEYMAVVGLDKTIVNMNSSFKRALGNNAERQKNKTCFEIMQVYCGSCEECLLDRTYKEIRNCEKEVYINNEAFIIRTYPLSDSFGKTKSALIVVQNTTGEKFAKNQMLQANKMVAVGQLAAGIAHEIRNPLGIIRNHSYIMKASYGSDVRLSKSLECIDKSVARASRIIDNLLNFSRISGENKELINIRGLIQGIIELEQKKLISQNIRTQVVCDSNISCYSNAESLKHILINLISNAADAIHSDGTISLCVSNESNNLVIEVRDTGCGIAKEELEKMFNPFYTTKEPGKGTGLGLYIAYNEVKKLNGDIAVNSRIGEGSIFSIRFPNRLEASAV